MAMANGNRPTMTAEVVGLEVDGDRQVFTVKVSAAHDSYNSYMVLKSGTCDDVDEYTSARFL